MKVLKNLEGVFLAAVAISSLAAYATADERIPQRAAPVVMTAAADVGQIQTVVVKAKRLTPEQKAAGL